MASPYSSNPYRQTSPYDQGPSAESGESYELGERRWGNPPADSQVLELADFLSRVTHVRNETRALGGDVAQIGRLHQAALASGPSSSSATSQQPLDGQVSAAQRRIASVREGIRALDLDRARTPKGSAARNSKDRQVDQLKAGLRRELESYREEELAYRNRYRDQISRQYRIVNPDATDEEVRQAAETDWGNEGVFQAALRNHRAVEASSVLVNVRARHSQLTQIERTLEELAGLFAELAAVVEEQDLAVVAIERNAETTVENLDKGTKQVSQAVVSAQRAKRLKWYCFFLVLFIVVAAGLVLGVGFGYFHWGQQ